MNLNKSVFATLVASFLSCFLIWTYWSVAARLVETGLAAAQPFFIGAGMAYIINIVMVAYEKLWSKVLGKRGAKARRPVALILSYLSFFLLAFLIFSVVLPDLVLSLRRLLVFDLVQLRASLEELQEQAWVKEVMAKTGQQTDLGQQVAAYSQKLLSQVLTLLTGLLTSASSIANALLSVFISLVFSIYVLASKETLARQFSLLIDTFTGRFAGKIYYLLGIFDQRFRGFFVSQSFEAVILATLTAIGMSLIGLPYVATISLLIAFTALIPVVGAYIGVTVGTILILTQSIQQAIIFLIFIVILQQFEGNLIYPRVVGGSIGLPAIWVLVAISLGGALAGILGMLVAVPVAASCYQIIKDLTQTRAKKLKKKLKGAI